MKVVSHVHIITILYIKWGRNELLELGSGRDSKYTVKVAYYCFSEDDAEEVVWAKDVWSPLIPLRMSALV